MSKTIILTHRGLEEGNNKFFESSFEAFEDHLKRGYGLEFDVNFTSDGEIVILHDKNLKRITSGQIEADIYTVPFEEVKNIPLGSNDNGIAAFDELMDLIELYNPPMNALHLKGFFQQDDKFINILIEKLKSRPSSLDKFIIFDTTAATAEKILKELPQAKLAASVAHDYDIERYNSCVYGTLLSLDELIKNKHLFEWVWLDEWDKTGPNGTRKEFYTQEIFDLLRSHGFDISLVTPELHASSPGLLGGESHPDAASQQILFRRIQQIIDLNPNAICTDYPEQAKSML